MVNGAAFSVIRLDTFSALIWALPLSVLAGTNLFVTGRVIETCTWDNYFSHILRNLNFTAPHGFYPAKEFRRTELKRFTVGSKGHVPNLAANQIWKVGLLHFFDSESHLRETLGQAQLERRDDWIESVCFALDFKRTGIRRGFILQSGLPVSGDASGRYRSPTMVSCFVS